MKKLPIAHIRLLCSAAIFIFIIGTFFKIPAGPLHGNGYVPYDNLTGLDFTYEYIKAYFTNASPTPDKSMVIVAFTVAIVMLMQLVAALVGRDKLIISTAAVMFFITVAGLVYIIPSSLTAVITGGYYAFMVVQLAIAVFTPIKPTETKQK